MRATLACLLVLLAASSGCKDPLEVAAARDGTDLPSLSAPGEGKVPAPPGPVEPEAAPAPREPGSAADSKAEAVPAEPAKARRAGARGAKAAPAAAGDRDTGDLRVTRFVVSRSVAGREPVGAASSFQAGEIDKLHAFVELSNEARAESEVFVTFSPPGGGRAHRTRLDVGAQKRWRTWAFTRKPRTPGVWTASVTDAAGRELGRTSFTVTP